jgi:Family of unknown function (DUF6065)
MKTLIAYLIDGHQVDIRSAPLEREWMEKSDQRFAYRCLPLNIANAYGWELLCPSGFSARWDGRSGKEAVWVAPDMGTTAPAVSHFGHGVLTFHVPCLFQTGPGVDLFVTGPLNRPKDGIAPLTGIIETDCAPYSFTMNWLFTRANWAVHFQKAEPFCHIFPVARGNLDIIEPELRRLSEAPDLERRHRQWTEGRKTFNIDLAEPGSRAAEERWQKRYFRGLEPTGEPGKVEGHQSRLRLKPFSRKE